MTWKRQFEVHPWIFFTSVVVIGLFLWLGAIFPEETGRVFESVQGRIVATFGWFYVLVVASCLLFAVYLFFSPLSQVRLGPDGSQPDYSNASWFAMLFSAGMGIGLVFFSVAEPVHHYMTPPRGEGGTAEAATEAMRLTFFHWGIHAWAIYIVVGMSLAYFSFRKGLPLSIRSAFHPLLGNRVNGPVGHGIDVLAIFGTLFGVATSLGLGVMQINAGLDQVFGIGIATRTQVILIGGITLIATTSVVLGLQRGIRRLSNFNLLVALALILFVFVTGPTAFILDSLIENTGNYLQHLVAATFWMNAFGGRGWHGDWTLFYWAWWIAWSPFVGMFIARISRGRSLRQFIAGVLLAPTGFTFVWLTVFGSTALRFEMLGAEGIAGAETERMLFGMLSQLPLSFLTSIAAIILIVSFFVTSSDSGSLVIDMLASGGNPDPPRIQRIFWALLEGAVASVLLVTGGLAALQTAALTTGLPFAALLLVMCWSLFVGLREERYHRIAIQEVASDLGGNAEDRI